MNKRREIGLDFVVDKLTNSIENVITGDSFKTEVSVLFADDIKVISKKNYWIFDWLFEYNQLNRDIYKLTIVNNESIIQGLISLEVMDDHVFIHLIENAPFNRGKSKVYVGVPGNLVAFACKVSFQHGHDGNVAFISKTKLVKYYEETLGAIHFGKQLMIIDNVAAANLTNKYFPTKL